MTTLQIVFLVIYSTGFGGALVLHTAFDGALASPKEGLLTGLIFAVLWPLFLIALLVASVVAVAKTFADKL